MYAGNFTYESPTIFGELALKLACSSTSNVNLEMQAKEKYLRSKVRLDKQSVHDAHTKFFLIYLIYSNNFWVLGLVIWINSMINHAFERLN